MREELKAFDIFIFGENSVEATVGVFYDIR